MIDAGTLTDPLAAPELEAPVPVPAADVDDDLGAAAADNVDDDELLLPQPTITAAQAHASATDGHVLIERIALLLFESQKTRGRIGKIGLVRTTPNRGVALSA
ncbi:MAG TPA: hypothetical protein VGH67_09340 [Solirubrobacteraceae bacterium]